jgi:hypothetical protein
MGLAGLGVLLNVHVDGKVSVDVTHLVLEALGDTDDEVVDDGADGAEGSDTLARAVVHLNGDDVLLGAAEGDGDVGEVLGELACRLREKKKLSMLSHPTPNLHPTVDKLACRFNLGSAYLGVPQRSRLANECESSLYRNSN